MEPVDIDFVPESLEYVEDSCSSEEDEDVAYVELPQRPRAQLLSAPEIEHVTEIELDPEPEPDNGDNASDIASDNASNLSDHNLTVEADVNEDVFHPRIPLPNFNGDREFEEDSVYGWKKLDEDGDAGIPALPFMGTSGLNMHTDSRKPEDFFNQLFDTNMWEQIADSTNQYAAKQLESLGPDAFQRRDNPFLGPHSRRNFWKPVSGNEIKVFIAHLIVMGIVRKAEIEQYWCTTGVAQTPFFGKWMSRNRWTAILANLHLVDDSNNPPYGQAGHNPLAKLEPFLTMCKENFRYTYSPERELSMDESCCPWKGRLRFKVYNPRKPARFHIKLFQMCESSSGYILGFNVYTGKQSCVNEAMQLMDPECSRTTKIVLTLAENCNVLDKGHAMYFDNYYTSPQLMHELLYRDTVACGTVRSNRKGMPKAVCKAKLTSGQTCFRRSYDDEETPGPLLALKWQDKRDVLMLSSFHKAEEQWTGRNDRSENQNPIYKPSVIVDYIKHMGGVDLSDQLLTYYSFLRKSCKWWRKLFVHLLNMLILNAHILNRKFGEESLSHSEFRERIARHLVQSVVEYDEANLQTVPRLLGDPFDLTLRLSERHFPKRITRKNGKIPSLKCRVCSVSKRKSKLSGLPVRRRSTSYMCEQCHLPMCVDPCFKVFHTRKNGRAD